MGIQSRFKLYQEWETLRGRPLIAYVTSIRPNLSCSMASDAVPFIINQINAIPSDKNEIDFLIISNGGDPITAQRIISILRERFEKIAVVVPYVAFSAATVLSFGADEIVMHPYSNLGPVDPQLTVPKNQSIQGQPTQLNFSSEDIRNYIDFIRSDVGISDQEHLATAFNALATEIGAINIGISKRGQQLSLTLSERMLETHMDDKSKAASIARSLNSDYYHHGYAVGRKEAKELGLSIVDPNPEEERVLWAIWEDFCEEMQCNRPFDPIAEVFSNPTAKSQIESIPIVDLPANMPPELAAQLFTNIANATSINQRVPIELRLPIAAIESIRIAYSVATHASMVYFRDLALQLNVNTTMYSEGWVKAYEGGGGDDGTIVRDQNESECDLRGTLPDQVNGTSQQQCDVPLCSLSATEALRTVTGDSEDELD